MGMQDQFFEAFDGVQKDVADARALIGAIDRELGGPNELAKMIVKMLKDDSTPPATKSQLFGFILRMRSQVSVPQADATETAQDIEREITSQFEELEKINQEIADLKQEEHAAIA